MKKIIYLSILFLVSINFVEAQTTFNSKNIGKSIDSTIVFIPNIDTTGPISQATPTGEGDRVVYWIHGLGGNQSSWIMAATASQQGVIRNGQTIFQSRKIESITDIKYDESIANFDMAVQSLQEIIHAKKLTLTQTERQSHFLIAHSQGGLVARYLDKQLNTTNPGNFYRDFGGIVTFGTPHSGAAVINNVQHSTKVYSFFKDACNDLVAGPLEEAIGDKLVVKIFGIDKKADQFKNLLCENIGLFSASLAKIYTGNLGLAYQTTSPTIFELKNYITPTPKVCFYGVAPTDGIAVSMLHSYGVSGANKYDNFEAHKSSTEAKQEAKELMDFYKIKAELTERKYKCEFNWVLIILPELSCWFVDVYKHTRDEYLLGVNFIKNMDDRWLDLIGARYTTQRTITELYCMEPGMPIINDPNSTRPCLAAKYKISDVESDPNGPTNPCAEYPGTVPVYSSRVVTDVVYKESDGIVLAESASGFPGTSSKSNRRLTGSNHEQIKNDINTKSALNKLYNGDCDLFFKTLPR